MKIARALMLIGLGLGVSACTAVDVPTRNAPFEQLPTTAIQTPAGYEINTAMTTAPAGAHPLADAVGVQVSRLDQSLPNDAAVIRSPVSVKQVLVRVPRSLKVSERNSYLPRGDIVWREDPIGDRHAQVHKIVQDAMVQGVSVLHGPVPVNIEIEMKRFHALTERARYTTGGVHALTFDLAIRHAETGELVVPVRTIKADLDAFGGQQAILAEARGLTQKVRISNHLAEVIRQELTNAEGYRNAQLGIYQWMHNI
jgi:hypothetical protein